MKKEELVIALSEKALLSKKDVLSVLNALVEVADAELCKGKEFKLFNIGTLSTVTKVGKAFGKDFNSKVVTFRTAESLKRAVNAN